MPDFIIHRVKVDKNNMNQNQREMIDELLPFGIVISRMTYLPEDKILILEGWKNLHEDYGPEPKLEDVIGFGI